MAIFWKYCTLVFAVFCLLFDVNLAQSSTTANITDENSDTTLNEPNTTAAKPTTGAPTLPLLPQTEGQPDFYVYKTEHRKLVPCSRTTFLASLSTQYTNTQGELISLDLEVPSDVTIGGECGDMETTLSLHWGDANFTAHYLNFTFVTKPPSDTEPKFSTWILQSISLTCNMDSSEFQDPLEGGFHSIESNPDTNYFETPLGLSYACNSEQSIGLEPTDNSSQVLQAATLTFTGLKLQPFQLPGNGVFGDAAICDADMNSIDESTGSSHAAAIAIATILSVVILATLITYYCMKRSQKTRYTSME